MYTYIHIYIAKPLGLCNPYPNFRGTLSQVAVPTAVPFWSQDASPALLGPCRYRDRMNRVIQCRPPSHLPRCHMSGKCSWNIHTRQKQTNNIRFFKYFLLWPSWLLGARLPVLKAILNVLFGQLFFPLKQMTIHQTGHIFQELWLFWLFEVFLHPLPLSSISQRCLLPLTNKHSNVVRNSSQTGREVFIDMS